MKWKIILLLSVLIGAILAVAGCLDLTDQDADTGEDGSYEMMEGMDFAESGYSGDPQNGNEPSLQTLDLELMEGMLAEIRFTLTWIDDEPESDPDEFNLEVSGIVGGSEKSFTTAGSSGELDIVVTMDGFSIETYDGDPEGLLGSSWKVSVSVLSCGSKPLLPIGPGIFLNDPDVGNAWELKVGNRHLMKTSRDTVDKAPDFTITDTDGNKISLSDLTDRIVILDLMMNCPTCEEQISHLKEVHKSFGNQIIIISVDIDPSDTEEDVRQIKEKHNADWIFARDTDNLIGKYKVTGMRKLFVINYDGAITFTSEKVVATEGLEKKVNGAMEGQTGIVMGGLSSSIFLIAFITGITAFFAPCAFPMLPGYITYYVSIDENKENEDAPPRQRSKRDVLFKGLLTGTVTALGIASIYIIFGLLLSIFGISIMFAIDFLAPIIGVLVILIGIIFVIGYHDYFGIYFNRAKRTLGLESLGNRMNLRNRFKFLARDGKEERSGYRGLFYYGMGYAAASTACHGIAFISIVLVGLASNGFVGSITATILWILGMVMIMILVTVILAFARKGFITFITKNIGKINRITGVFLILAGVVIIIYEYTV